MPELTSYEPGAFCWLELGTSDRLAATTFYTTLFGWTSASSTLPDGRVHVMLEKDGCHTGAIYENNGAHPAWLSYIWVNDADESAEKAQSLGGSVVQPPFEFLDIGRMAIIKDPGGAGFALWQASRPSGLRVKDEPGSLCWSELTTPDPAACEPFYTQLFGWQAKHAVGMDYTEWHLGGRAIGGMMPPPPGMGIPPHWMPYFAVADCDATLELAKSLGVTESFGPHEVPNVGRFAIMHDPQGARFAVIRLAGGSDAKGS